MAKRKMKNSRKRRNGGRRQQGLAKQFRLVKSVVDSPMRRDINLQFQVYAVFNQPAGISLYSFSNSLTQVSPTLTQDITASMLASTEFSRYKSDFAYYKFNSIRCSLSNNIFGSSTLASVPPLFYRFTTFIAGAVTADGVGRSDTSTEYKITNLNKNFQSTHKLPKILIGSSGNPIGGTELWMPTDLSLTTSYQLQIGNITNPDFTSASSTFTKLVTMDVICGASESVD